MVEEGLSRWTTLCYHHLRRLVRHKPKVIVGCPLGNTVQFFLDAYAMADRATPEQSAQFYLDIRAVWAMISCPASIWMRGNLKPGDGGSPATAEWCTQYNVLESRGPAWLTASWKQQCYEMEHVMTVMNWLQYIFHLTLIALSCYHLTMTFACKLHCCMALIVLVGTSLSAIYP